MRIIVMFILTTFMLTGYTLFALSLELITEEQAQKFIDVITTPLMVICFIIELLIFPPLNLIINFIISIFIYLLYFYKVDRGIKNIGKQMDIDVPKYIKISSVLSFRETFNSVLNKELKEKTKNAILRKYLNSYLNGV